ncbi:MAG: hypothetical protein KTR18_12635 [Acidiferrobacterales bacterium]|nr:hypothetical protein [Acidiferrobacterales bacterium]
MKDDRQLLIEIISVLGYDATLSIPQLEFDAMSNHLIRRFLFLFFLLSVSTCAMADQKVNAEVKETMRQALESLTYLIDFALDIEGKNEKDSEFRFNLERMQSLSAGITEHTSSVPYSLNLVTLTLEETIDQMVANYKMGFDHSAESYLIETVDHCVACHTQSPGLKNDIDVKALISTIYSEEVNPSVASRIFIAARRIPEAIQIWEGQVLDKEFTLDQPAAESMLLEYISQVLHLESGLDNLYVNLKKLQARETTPFYFARKLGIWIKQIEHGTQRHDADLSVDLIRKVKKECVDLEGVSVREEYLVCSILVSSMSAEMLRDLSPGDTSVESQLYINLGIARLDSTLPTGYVPHIESFLEAAIIASPDTDIAREAYAHLEELAYFLYNDIDIAEEVMGVSFEGLKQLAGIN